MRSCKEYQSFFPDPVTTWAEVIAISDQLHGMIGIDRQIYSEARQRLGAQKTASIILCILEGLHQIRKPGAYLRGLMNKAEKGLLNLSGLLYAARSTKIVS